MSNRVEGYGLTKEVGDKIKLKYSIEDEQKCLDWIERCLSRDLNLLDGNEGADATREKLKDGVILCNLVNEIIRRSEARGKVNPVRKINKMKSTFFMMENLSHFLEVCEKMGVEKHSLFQSVDLFDGSNMHNLIITLFALGRKAQKFNFSGPVLGPKEAAENRRSFTQEQLSEGKHIIGLQMGSNKGASQTGIKFGKSRSVLME